MNPKHRGALNEVKATAWLLEQGYEVFVNISQHGNADLVIRDPLTDVLTMVDVSTGLFYTRKDGSVSISMAHKSPLPDNVRILIITADNHFLWYDK